MKKRVLIGLVVGLALAATVSVVWAGQGVPQGGGWTPYADVHVTWDGVSPQGDWWVDWDLDGDTADDNYGCNACLDMNYDFTYRGSTMHFDEVYVEAALAHPQTHHVVLHDNDGDGTYVGAITARYDAPWSPSCHRRMDVIEYWITPSDFGTWGSFFYIEHEYCLKAD